MSMITFRSFELRDAEAIGGVYAASVRGLAAGSYGPDQIRVWSALAPGAEAMRQRYGDGRYALVAVDEADRVLGFSDVGPDGYVDMLYVHPDAAGRGVARGLLAALEAEARSKGLARLHSEASETALPVFVKCGFRRLHRRDFEVSGVPIHNHAVEKRLDPSDPT